MNRLFKSLLKCSTPHWSYRYRDIPMFSTSWYHPHFNNSCLSGQIWLFLWDIWYFCDLKEFISFSIYIFTKGKTSCLSLLQSKICYCWIAYWQKVRCNRFAKCKVQNVIMLQNGIIQQNVNAKILPSLPDLFPVQWRREGANHFLHIFHLQRTLQRYHFATSETDDKSKTNVQMWSKNFHKAFWDTIFHKQIFTNQENGGNTDQYKSLKGNIRRISIAYNLNYPHLVDCKIQNFGDICKNFGWTSWVIVLFPP